MQCAQCREGIEDDSQFCDQCGTAILLCPTCKIPGKGKFCIHCRTALVSWGQGVTVPQTPPPATPVISGRTGTYVLPSRSQQPTTLRLVNRNLQVDLEIIPDSIIGRTTGPYTDIFGRHGNVSGQHCTFRFDPTTGWTVSDLGSTNQTKYNSKALTPQVPQALADGGYLDIANLEFYVQIQTTLAEGRK